MSKKKKGKGRCFCTDPALVKVPGFYGTKIETFENRHGEVLEREVIDPTDLLEEVDQPQANLVRLQAIVEAKGGQDAVLALPDEPKGKAKGGSK